MESVYKVSLLLLLHFTGKNIYPCFTMLSSHHKIYGCFRCKYSSSKPFLVILSVEIFIVGPT